MPEGWWGICFVVVVCPLIGGIPLTGWITYFVTGKKLAELGTGNVGVSAAFYHGGTGVGILAVLIEAAKGIGVVWGARQWLPPDPVWELAALVALVAGRYWIGKGAGTTNVVWGIVAYRWPVALLVFVFSGGITAFAPDRRMGRWIVLMVLPLTIALQVQSLPETGMAIVLSGLLAWIYTQLRDDLALSTMKAQPDSQTVFEFLRNRTSALVPLDQPLQPHKVGAKAATLSQLKRWGYAVPDGWVVPPGDDAEPLILALKPSPDHPLAVRSSAIGEDSPQASAAGQYETVLHVTSRSALRRAIAQCQDCYDNHAAAQYRQDRGVSEGGMAVMVQVQIQGQFSGVAFSRDPIAGNTEDVAIEGLPGSALQVVSGQMTPERYWVTVPTSGISERPPSDLAIRGETGRLPPDLIRQVALLVRDLEGRYHGMPQDMEWTYDGKTLWVLQTRPITTLTPIWTRRIAAEVIPGAIRPLTWSINNPLTCGVWADLFRQILGPRSMPFQVRELATLHYGHAYFNATLMGQLFLQMGLPAESLDFLTRGASMGRPAPLAILKTLPGLLQLLWQEWTLAIAFRRDQRTLFTPCLGMVAERSAQSLSPEGCLDHIDQLLTTLQRATFFSILAPISAAIRQTLLRIADAELDATVLPEAAALRSLWTLAIRHPEAIAALPPEGGLSSLKPTDPLFQAIETFLAQYGYLSDVATDIAIPTWREDPQPIWGLLQGFGTMQTTDQRPTPMPGPRQRWAAGVVQRRLVLKGQVAEVYGKLLAQLRYTLLALAQHGLEQGLLQHPEDIFFLTLSEIRTWVGPSDVITVPPMPQRIAERRHEFELAQALPGVPTVIYGTPPPLSILQNPHPVAAGAYTGIGASPGFAEGIVCVLRSLTHLPNPLSRQTILVVPYTDAGWSPILAQVGGIVAEVGGRLSHGAIVAREYGIPAVMDIAHATQRFKDGQRVKVDGYRGIVEVLPHDG